MKGVKYIQIPVTDNEYDEIFRLKGRDESWRDFVLPKLMPQDMKE